MQLLKQNAHYRLPLNEFLAELPSFIGYYSGESSKSKMLEFEIKLTESDSFKELYAQFLDLVGIIRWNRRRFLLEYIKGSTTTKLTGNIWGNRWSVVSALFIILIGILIWYTDNYVEPPIPPPSEQTTTDSTIKSTVND